MFLLVCVLRSCAALCWYEGGRVKVMRKLVFLPQLIQLDTATPRYTGTRAHLRTDTISSDTMGLLQYEQVRAVLVTVCMNHGGYSLVLSGPM